MVASLRCTVRGCGEVLLEEPRRAVCPKGHSFDRAREGYLSLLQPQDRRSRRPGDDLEVARSRRRLAALGHDNALFSAIAKHPRSRPEAGANWLDVGCGEGSLLGRLSESVGDGLLSGSGVDLSAASIALAARANPGLQWVVANADRALPWVDGSFQVVLSVVARLPVAELARVLAPDGVLVVAVAGDQDLAELRRLLLGELHPAGRLASALERLAPDFEVFDRSSVRQRLDLDAEGLADLARASYLGGRGGRAERLEGIEGLTVSIERDIVWCRRRE